MQCRSSDEILEEGRNPIFCSSTIFCKHKLEIGHHVKYFIKHFNRIPNLLQSEPCIDRSVCPVDLAVRASPWHVTDSNRTRNNSRLRTNRVWHPNIELQSGKVLHPLFEKDWRPVLSINTAIFWLAGAARVSHFVVRTPRSVLTFTRLCHSCFSSSPIRSIPRTSSRRARSAAIASCSTHRSGSRSRRVWHLPQERVPPAIGRVVISLSFG